MELELVCQGRRISSEQLLWLGQWVADHPQWSRKRLSRELCQEWDWRNGRGRIKDFAARALLEKLRRARLAGFASSAIAESHPRPKPAGVAPINWPADPISEPVGELASWQWILPLAGTPEAKHFDAYLQRYHYLGLRVVGQNMKYLVRDKQGRDVACLLFWRGRVAGPSTGSIYRLGSSATGRRSSLSGQQQSLSDPALGQSPRPGQPPLSQVARRLSQDWQHQYGHPIYLLESFVERGDLAGLVIGRAIGCVGQTRGEAGKGPTRASPPSLPKMFISTP